MCQTLIKVVANKIVHNFKPLHRAVKIQESTEINKHETLLNQRSASALSLMKYEYECPDKRWHIIFSDK
jgi:hypothetical protein